MNYAPRLIAAIQTAEPDRLRALLAEIAQIPNCPPAGDDAHPVNHRLADPLGLTALHVAGKAYAVHADDTRLGDVFNTMVADLLEAGANPLVEMGVKRGWTWVGSERIWGIVGPGMTVAEVCERRLPPSLQKYLADRAFVLARPTFMLRKRGLAHGGNEDTVEEECPSEEDECESACSTERAA